MDKMKRKLQKRNKTEVTPKPQYKNPPKIWVKENLGKNLLNYNNLEIFKSHPKWIFLNQYHKLNNHKINNND